MHNQTGNMNSHLAPQFHLKIPSRLENIELIDPFVAQIKQYRTFSEAKYFDILLVLTEAVNNAILHGNCANPNKYVNLYINIHSNQLQFIIIDEGCGFNPRNLSDPTQAARRTEPNGRGVFLMQKLADEIQFSYHNNSNIVSILFNVWKKRIIYS